MAESSSASKVSLLAPHGRLLTSPGCALPPLLPLPRRPGDRRDFAGKEHLAVVFGGVADHAAGVVARLQKLCALPLMP